MDIFFLQSSTIRISTEARLIDCKQYLSIDNKLDRKEELTIFGTFKVLEVLFSKCGCFQFVSLVYQKCLTSIRNLIHRLCLLNSS